MEDLRCGGVNHSIREAETGRHLDHNLSRAGYFDLKKAR
jgi:hypothetical protein